MSINFAFMVITREQIRQNFYLTVIFILGAKHASYLIHILIKIDTFYVIFRQPDIAFSLTWWTITSAISVRLGPDSSLVLLRIYAALAWLVY